VHIENGCTVAVHWYGAYIVRHTASISSGDFVTTPSASPRRSRRVITHEEICDAAVAIVDASGLQALSMRRLADATGVGVMTLYGFFESKDLLVASLATHVWGEVGPTPDPGLPWQEQLMGELCRLRRSLQEHPGLIELLSFSDDAAPGIDRHREGLLAILLDAGINERIAVDALGSVVALTLGFTVGARARNIGLDDHAYDRLRTIPTTEFPHLTAVAEHYASHWSDRAFELGARAIIDSLG
jgi:AcrR family transcriptional regulator